MDNELQTDYARLLKHYAKFCNYYSSSAKNVQEWGEPFVELPKLEEIDFSNFNRARQQIQEQMDRFSILYLWDAEIEAIRSAKRKFVSRAISKMPNENSIVVITTSYKPKEINVSGFWKLVDLLAKEKDKKFPHISAHCCIVWFAFCPKEHSTEKITKFCDDWWSYPDATVRYL